ncbi:MAG: GyrI-like domain-containing protein [Armatimonadetes bacterium]|nr:GyrI-like domain-containing protein [Armatimonadota bacterium]
MQTQIQEHPAFVVVGVRHQGGMQNGELPALWERYAQDLNALASTTPGVFPLRGL